ncbi:MAG: lipopolysaccharide heptosyltransferase family protein [Candidatus Acididesulfobacter guangdongensis]|uniref:Lipopolysaccharide heptosyltransferase family protein n=1 Tax=Acididesulfobacter guangdongensis TaxID=2597225 RepID=A0A519BHX7_ACIG2|nr:MAG: lipopolysaccharide heptosyltransferase family protein [Candidatus Acididesulfobacter guangdongensis]
MTDFNIKRIAKTLKRRLYKLYNKLFIYMPAAALIFLRSLLLTFVTLFRILLRQPSNRNRNPNQNSNSNPNLNTKRIIIFRQDGIGDYILFRNFLEILKKTPAFSDYKITLLGNAAWKDLAEFLDKEFVDEFIWLDKKRITTDFFYRYKKFKEITSVKYDILIHPFGREFFNADNDLAYLIKADKKIGSIRSSRFLKPYRRIILEKIYDILIPDAEGLRFEFYKNRNFFEKMTGREIKLEKPFINLDFTDKARPPYAAFFIGASVKHRKWSAKNFAEVASYLKNKHGYETVLCGGKDELNDTSEFKKYFPFPFTDTVGKISLIELLSVIKGASLVVSNETMAPHIAMALAKSAVIVISTGGPPYGLFVPYPAGIAGSNNYAAVFHPEIEKNIDDYIKTTKRTGHGYDDKFDIAEITVESVIQKIEKLLKKK